MRFTIGKLLLAVALIALACAGMRSPSFFWSCIVLSVTIFLYVMVGIRAVGLTGSNRTAAVAFVIVGGGYLLFATCELFRSASTSLITNYPLAAVVESQKMFSIRPGHFITRRTDLKQLAVRLAALR